MDENAKWEIVSLLKSLDKNELWRLELQDFVKQCYARVWIGICLDHSVQPPHAASRTTILYKEMLPLLASAAVSVGLHNKYDIKNWHGPQAALLACQLWRNAMADQERNQQRSAPHGIVESEAYSQSTLKSSCLSKWEARSAKAAL
jgi:hypothetical protein